MLKLRAFAIIAFTFAGIHVSWQRFSSTLFPYTISQPSSYRHVVYADALGRQGDFFFPGLGSFITNVNVYAEPAHVVHDQYDLRAMGAKRVTRSGWVRVEGKSRPLMRAEFHGIPGHWIVEQVTFVDLGRLWHLTASYDVKYRSLRPTMLKMIQSFRVR